MDQSFGSHVLYPPVEPLSTGWLEVGDGHRLYWEQSGNPDGLPVLFCHGGPGAGTTAVQRRFFDPARFRIILLDQRGCGRSTPLGAVTANSPDHLVADLEALRAHLGLPGWLLFGGSWGATLALAYAQRHPERVRGLVLRGVFLMRSVEIDWFLMRMGHVFPEAWTRFVTHIPEAERDDLLAAYDRRLKSPDRPTALAAARAWNAYEASCSAFRPSPAAAAAGGLEPAERALALARIEAHFFRHCRFDPEDRLLREAGRLAGIPGIIVQGRYDMICPMASAWALHRAWPDSELQIVPDGAHASTETPMAAALVTAIDRFKHPGGENRG